MSKAKKFKKQRNKWREQAKQHETAIQAMGRDIEVQHDEIAALRPAAIEFAGLDSDTAIPTPAVAFASATLVVLDCYHDAMLPALRHASTSQSWLAPAMSALAETLRKMGASPVVRAAESLTEKIAEPARKERISSLVALAVKGLDSNAEEVYQWQRSVSETRYYTEKLDDVRVRAEPPEGAKKERKRRRRK